MIRLTQLFFIACLALLISACETARAPASTTNVLALQNLSTDGMGAGKIPVKISRIRLMALKDTAMSIGARSGLASRANEINVTLRKEEKILDFTYNFYGVLLKNDILPPVLVEADTALTLDDPNTIRLAQKIYKIEKQAHFVTAPPTWRDYLWMYYPTPDLPDATLLPKSLDEKKVWNYYVAQGWNQGVAQANSIFTANLARIKRDYNGMVLYRKLYMQNMVSAPFVAKVDLGITGDSTNMRIDDKVLRITALPALNLKANTWKPAVVPGDPPAPVSAENHENPPH